MGEGFSGVPRSSSASFTISWVAETTRMGRPPRRGRQTANKIADELVTLPGRQLWRRRIDGSEAVQLTKPAFPAAGVALVSGPPAHPNQCGAAGSAVEDAATRLDEEWTQAGPDLSPDGETIVFGRWGQFDRPSKVAIYLYDLRCRAVSKLRGSTGMGARSWSPDGRYILAGDVFPGRTCGHDVGLPHAHLEASLFGPQEQTNGGAWSRDLLGLLDRCLRILAVTAWLVTEFN
jgi:hypothetical protein